ncbi:hypothetical protein [Paractinoplanes toevensis]|uniref:Uncharacterized protein n=1 Tax=Paractinoplanes toevensis TaxID=571911 RepID=A0A919W7R7_9ACTN|nr:hypothetical protein [Actinoplanes toevensis]GIM90021.1 hypothetical protein Ato02nite_018140 [Actinoplanes toevensis]
MREPMRALIFDDYGGWTGPAWASSGSGTGGGLRRRPFPDRPGVFAVDGGTLMLR